MAQIIDSTTAHTRPVESDLSDIYLVARRIPKNGNALLHAYESEVLIPLRLEDIVDRIVDEITIRDALAAEAPKKKRAA